MMLISTCMLAAVMGWTDVPVKHIGAPASDLDAGWLREPDPREHGARAHHGVLLSTFTDDTITVEFHVPSPGQLRLLGRVGEGAVVQHHAVDPDRSIGARL